MKVNVDNYLNIEKGLNYSDIFMVPNKETIVDSRSECDTSVVLGKHRFVSPVVPANMKSVVSMETCKFLRKNNWFYIMHRFNVDLLSFSREMKDIGEIVSISVGVNEDSYIQLENLKKNGITPEYITIDIANAWCNKAKKMTQYIKENFKNSFLIIGNVATSEAVIQLESWGVDCIKIFISPGKSCITKNKTGFLRCPVNTIIDCGNAVKNVPLIADGGIIEHGDINKALAVSGGPVELVMAGFLFAGYEQSAGDIIEIEDKKYKEYFGSASEKNKGKRKNVEGKKMLVPFKGDMQFLLDEIIEDIQSAISYSGGKDLDHLRKHKEFTTI